MVVKLVMVKLKNTLSLMMRNLFKECLKEVVDIYNLYLMYYIFFYLDLLMKLLFIIIYSYLF